MIQQKIVKLNDIYVAENWTWETNKFAEFEVSENANMDYSLY